MGKKGIVMTLATILPCPFCGKTPRLEKGKKSFCQLHGEPSQPMIVRCANTSCCRPQWAAGDVFNGGEEKAKLEVIEKWNTRHISEEDVEALELCGRIEGASKASQGR